MDYATLIAAKSTDGSIKNWVQDDAVPAAALLEDAQSFIYRRLRVRQMLTTATGVLSTATNTVTAPTDLIWPGALWLTGTDAGKVPLWTPERVEARRTYDGTGGLTTARPAGFAPVGVALVFPSTPDKAYPYRFPYLAQPAALSTATTTNFLTDRFPRLLRCALAMAAAEWKKDWEDAEKWGARTLGEIETANAENDLAQMLTDVSVEPR